MNRICIRNWRFENYRAMNHLETSLIFIGGKQENKYNGRLYLIIDLRYKTV